MFFGDMANVASTVSIFPPLNLAYLAAIAEKEGHEVQIIDGEAEHLSMPAIIELVKEFPPGLIGLTSTTPMFHIVLAQARALKKELKASIVVGGPHVTFFKK